VRALPPLFDVNGRFGRSATGESEFPTIRSRLQEMDRLGISRSIVWNIEATQHQALASNARLIEEVQHTPDARRRIVPGLVVSGLMAYERDGIEKLRRQMLATGSRALRFHSVFARLTLGQTEPVICRIRDLKPFIILRHDTVPPADILGFAERFPEVPVVLTEVSWGSGIIVYDLMRQRPNILLDNSWLHTFNAIELVVKHFGAERIVFGTGYQSHNGAAIAALARADITPEQRRTIAHGSLDRLTGTESPANPARPSTANGKGRFWRRCLAGQPLGVDVVDAHAHLGPSAGYVIEEQEEAGQIRLALSAMKTLGIRNMIFSGLQALLGDPLSGNDRLQKHLEPHAKQLIGYVSFNPCYAKELVRRLDQYFAGSVFVGFKLLCGYWRVSLTDPRFAPMWEYANRHRLPVLMHTWTGGPDSPAMLEQIVPKYPDVAFICGHSGGTDGGRREAEALAQAHSNVYLETCGSFCSTIRWEDTLQRVSPQQVVYGTDAMAHDITWELGRLLSVDVADEVLVPILGGNLRRILARRR